jgi:DNA-3-methyladenine glycosylase I
MCNSNVKSAGVAQIAGRPVLQPAGNRVAAPEVARPLKKSLQKSLSMPASYDNAAPTCAAPPKSPGAGDFTRATAAAPCLLPPTPAKAAGARAAASVGAEKSRKAPKKAGAVLPVVTFAALEAFEVAGPAGSIAAAQREHVTQAQAQRKSRIAHYGRTASFSRVEGRVGATATATAPAALDEKRCSFITAYSDPVYVAYHDEEWGLPVHDDE